MDDAPAPAPPRDDAGRPTDAAPAAQADASSAPPGRYRLLEWSLWLLRMGPGLILIVLVLVINGLTPLFLTPRNLGNVLAQTAVISVLAMGQLLVILTRGVDLSVGSVVALGSVAGGLVFSRGGSGAAVILTMLAVGLGVGLINGLVYVVGRIPHPFIVTLAMLSIARGFALWLSDGRVLPGMPPAVQTIGGASLGRLPLSSLVVAGLAVAVFLLCTRMLWGRWIYAVGGNPDAARRTGIPVGRVLVSVYALSGLAAGIGAVLIAGRTDAGSPNFGTLAELDSIAAVVIGGASFLGGRGNVGNALVGALMIGVIRNALNLLNIDAFFQLIAIGVVIVVAVQSDVLRTHLEARFRVARAARS
ncbi:MAG TPA: ABC transporter permease [Egibacteraceae bacterium]|nr:ABC transporter permease [Egibacteraceae bacterium]